MDSTLRILRRIFFSSFYLDVEGNALHFCGNNGQVMVLEDRDVWLGTSSFTDPLHSSPTMMQLSHSRKRQNCGSTGLEHLSTDVGSMVPLGVGHMNCTSRLNTRSSQSDLFEIGNNNLPRLPFSNVITPDGSWNAMLSSSPLQRPLSDSVGAAFNGSYSLVGEGGRNPYKRKSTMDLYPDSSTHTMSFGRGDSIYYGLAQDPGACQNDTSFNSLNSFADESGMRRDEQGVYHSIRTSAPPVNLHDGSSTSMTQDNYSSSSVTHNERGLGRFFPRSDNINDSLGNIGVGRPETFPLIHGNGVSVNDSWRRSGIYREDSSSQSGFLGTMRIYNPSIDGNGFRQVEASDTIGASPVDTRSHQPPHRAMRSTYFQNPTSQSFQFPSHIPPNPYAHLGTYNRHLPSFPSVQLANRYSNMQTMVVLPGSGIAPIMSALTPGQHAGFGDSPSVGMPGQSTPRYNEASRTSFLRQVSLRGSRALQSDGMNRQRYSTSHTDLSNQFVSYEWGDVYDEHNDMRLDVDNMSYEELLALEERIGNVNTGLNEGNIQSCLKISTYSHPDGKIVVESQESDSKCSVCQEEFVEGDELGELQCGHGYHTDCIKQWLLLKNQCPICKSAAS